MKPKLIPVLEMCIQNGIRLGWNRAHKHTDKPEDESVFHEIEYAIETEIYEWFDFEEADRD